MPKIVLINDVAHFNSEHGLLGVPEDAVPSTAGVNQISAIVNKIREYPKSHGIICSNSTLVDELMHRIRRNCVVHQDMIFRTECWRERDFGVMTGSVLSHTSDVFCHERVCTEGGESIKMCRDRALGFIKKVFGDKSIICISHPYLCQIVSNVFLNKQLTYLGDFWHKKGSISMLDYDFFKGATSYNFNEAYNCLEKKHYSPLEI